MSNRHLHDSLIDAFGACSRHESETLWFGSRIAAKGRADEETALAAVLYSRWFVLGSVSPSPSQETTLPWGCAANSVRALAQANRGKGPIVGPHRSLGTTDDGCHLIDLQGMRVAVPADHVVHFGGTGGDDALHVRLPNEQTWSSNGYYSAVGDLHGTAPLTLRIYLNLAPGAVVPIMAWWTEQLNEACVPYVFKVRYDLEGWTQRTDVGVGLVPIERWGDIQPLLVDLHRGSPGLFRAAVPTLVAPVLPGVGVATQPAGLLSFGLHRSRVVAEAISRGLDARADVEAFVGIAAEVFRANGVDPEHPYRGLGEGFLPGSSESDTRV